MDLWLYTLMYVYGSNIKFRNGWFSPLMPDSLSHDHVYRYIIYIYIHKMTYTCLHCAYDISLYVYVYVYVYVCVHVHVHVHVHVYVYVCVYVCVYVYMYIHTHTLIINNSRYMVYILQYSMNILESFTYYLLRTSSKEMRRVGWCARWTTCRPSSAFTKPWD